MVFRRSMCSCLGNDKLTKCLKADVKDYCMVYVELLRNELSTLDFNIHQKNIFELFIMKKVIIEWVKRVFILKRIKNL